MFFKYIYSPKQRLLVKTENTASDIQFICFAIAAGKLNIFLNIAKNVLIYVSRIWYHKHTENVPVSGLFFVK